MANLGVVPGHAGPSTSGALLRRALRRRRRSLAGAAALITQWQICEALVPVAIGITIERAVSTGRLSELVLCGAGMSLLFVVLSLSYRFGSRIGLRAVQLETHELRTEVTAHVLRPDGARTDRLAGDLLTVATSDAEHVGELVRQVVTTIGAVVGLLVAAVALAVIDPVIALVVLVGVPLVMGVSHVLSGPLARRSRVRQEALGRATGLAADLLRGLRPLKGIHAEQVALSRYRTTSRVAARASVRAGRWEGVLEGSTLGLSGLFLAVVALLAGFRALDGELSVGGLVAVLGLAQYVAEPMGILAFTIAQFAEARASADRVVEVLGTPPLVHEGDALPQDPPVLAFEDVTDGPLTGVTWTAGPGEMVALVMEDPADAEATMRLLRGERRPDAGRVSLGGVSLVDCRLDALRARLLVVDHHTDLFEATLRDNLDPTGRLDDRALASVLAASAVDEVAEHLAGGLDEMVGADGVTLSGGQRQRLTLGRALAVDAPVMVLHDPLSSVDSVTEDRVAVAVAEQRRDRVTVVITSSPAVASRADRVVHLRAGRVVASGTHAELVRSEAYAAAVLR